MEPQLLDSVYVATDLISNVDSVNYSQMLDVIARSSEQIVKNTDITFWGESLGEIILKTLSLLATAATIIGIFGVLIIYYQRRFDKKCQRKTIIDLIRHLYVNNTIAESVYFTLRERLHEMHPEGGTFARFSVLDSDLDFGRFHITSKNYEVIHRCNLKMRNYNIMVNQAEAYFQDLDCLDEIKKDSLVDVVSRGNGLMDDLLELAKLLKIKIENSDVEQFIEAYSKERVEDAKLKMIFDADLDPRADNELRMLSKHSKLKWEDKAYYNEMVCSKMGIIKYYPFRKLIR